MAVIALLVVFAAGKLLIRGHWLRGWLRGMTGIIFLALSVLLVLISLDLYSYKQLSKEQTIASISFTKLAPQSYQTSIVDSSGMEQTFILSGDLWQLDARIIKWNTFISSMGVSPGYRLDRISGRYYSLEQEQTAPRTVYKLEHHSSFLDVWGWLREHDTRSAIVDASYGSATYLPMEDGALFSVSLSSTGLLSRPLNDRAKAAINGWQ